MIPLVQNLRFICHIRAPEIWTTSLHHLQPAAYPTGASWSLLTTCCAVGCSTEPTTTAGATPLWECAQRLCLFAWKLQHTPPAGFQHSSQRGVLSGSVGGWTRMDHWCSWGHKSGLDHWRRLKPNMDILWSTQAASQPEKPPEPEGTACCNQNVSMKKLAYVLESFQQDGTSHIFSQKWWKTRQVNLTPVRFLRLEVALSLSLSLLFRDTVNFDCRAALRRRKQMVKIFYNGHELTTKESVVQVLVHNAKKSSPTEVTCGKKKGWTFPMSRDTFNLFQLSTSFNIFQHLSTSFNFPSFNLLFALQISSGPRSVSQTLEVGDRTRLW